MHVGLKKNTLVVVSIFIVCFNKSIKTIKYLMAGALQTWVFFEYNTCIVFACF